jgi:Flp pilus assembly protein TadB
VVGLREFQTVFSLRALIMGPLLVIVGALSVGDFPLLGTTLIVLGVVLVPVVIWRLRRNERATRGSA